MMVLAIFLFISLVFNGIDLKSQKKTRRTRARRDKIRKVLMNILPMLTKIMTTK